MEKLKEKLHIRRKSNAEEANTQYEHNSEDARNSVDSELAAMTPEERDAYLKEFDEADKTGEPKKGSLIEKLISRGNKRTEDQILQESRDRKAKASAPKDDVIR